MRYRGKGQGGEIAELVASDERTRGRGSATGHKWDRAVKAGAHAVVINIYDPTDKFSQALEGAYQRAALALFTEYGFVSVFFKVDAKRPENRHLLDSTNALAPNFQIATTPALLVFVDGVLVDEYLSHTTKWDLVEYMHRWLTGEVNDTQRQAYKTRVHRRVAGGTGAFDWASLGEQTLVEASHPRGIIDHDDL